MKLIIYIPGLGSEGVLYRQRKIVSKWNKSDTKAVFLESQWRNSNEEFNSKLERLLKDIDELELDNYSKVTFFGTSAGGTLGLNLFNEFKDSPNAYFVALCGKITGTDNIGKNYSQPHPALITSIAYSENVLKKELKVKHKKRITSVVPLYDEVVHKPCMYIEGANMKKQFTVLHAPSIALGITLFRKNILKTASSPMAQ